MPPYMNVDMLGFNDIWQRNVNEKSRLELNGVHDQGATSRTIASASGMKCASYKVIVVAHWSGRHFQLLQLV